MVQLGQQNIEQKIKDLNSKYLPQVRRILINKAYIFTRFREATLKEDQEYGFDAVLSFPDVKIPIRIRKNEYLKFMDLTIRSKYGNGSKTEIHKIMEGFGDFYFYGWSDETNLKKQNNKIVTYMILDLNIFRNTILDRPTFKDKANGDGTYFNCYNRDLLFNNNVVKVFETL